jgi:hypothetical protein
VFSGFSGRVEAGQPDVAQQMLIELSDFVARAVAAQPWRTSATTPTRGDSAAGATIQPCAPSSGTVGAKLRSAVPAVFMSSPFMMLLRLHFRAGALRHRFAPARLSFV